MNDKDSLRLKYLIKVVVILFVFLIFFFLFLNFRIHNLNKRINEGYDYCVEWRGFNDGIIRRDSMLYNCYDLATLEFNCDYKIMDNNQLMIKPILNVTKNNEGLIIEIIYDEPIYHNCTRWLKSRR